MPFLQLLVERAQALLGTQPLLLLFIAAAVLASFLAIALKRDDNPSLAWSIWHRLGRLVWATLVAGLLAGTAAVLASHLERVAADFRHDHGRVTETNLSAVRSIWGPEQQQGELSIALNWEEETIERLESEDPTKPTVTRKKTIRHAVAENPFVRARHVVTLRQSPRQKGPAMYAGYTTDNQFTWHLRNPADRELKATLRFPLPATSAMYDNLAVTLDGNSVREKLRVESGALVLERTVAAGAEFDYEVRFQSRGLSHWYFQVREAREIRDLELKLVLPDTPRKSLNYPEGCMTPTEIIDASDRKGATLVYRLDRALSNKGMGIEMPELIQPGTRTSAVLDQARKGWVLLFAAVLLGATLAGYAYAPLVTALTGIAMALGFGLLGDFSDTPLGFWGTTAILVLPLVAALAIGLQRLVTGNTGRWLAVQVVAFGFVYPWLAGLDDKRELLYLNLCAALFVVAAAWQLARRLRSSS
jgi:hypothetical protein